MSKDRYFDQLEDTAISILKRVGNTGEITQTDLALLNIYKKECKAQKGDFTVSNLLSGLKKVVGFINTNLGDK